MAAGLPARGLRGFAGHDPLVTEDARGDRHRVVGRKRGRLRLVEALRRHPRSRLAGSSYTMIEARRAPTTRATWPQDGSRRFLEPHRLAQDFADGVEQVDFSVADGQLFPEPRGVASVVSMRSSSGAARAARGVPVGRLPSP